MVFTRKRQYITFAQGLWRVFVLNFAIFYGIKLHHKVIMMPKKIEILRKSYPN